VVALILLFATILVALIVVQAGGIGGFVPYTHGWKTLTAAAALVGLIFCLGLALIRWPFERKVFCVALGTVLLLVTIQFVLPDDTIEHKAPGAFLLSNASRVGPQTVLVSLEDPLRAVCWFYKRSDVFQLGGGGELSYGFGYPDGRGRLLDAARFTELVKTHQRGRVVLVGKAKHYRKWKTKLPPPIFEDTSGPGGYVFAQY